MKNEKIPENIVSIVLYAVALAMGIVSIILNVLQQPVDIIMLAIGLTALAIAGLNAIDKKK
ncbi:MAG: hypothetical protein ACXAC5_14260 [Promethearchaeota archaeon]|jgi:hypothetical protein